MSFNCIHTGNKKKVFNNDWETIGLLKYQRKLFLRATATHFFDVFWWFYIIESTSSYNLFYPKTIACVNNLFYWVNTKITEQKIENRTRIVDFLEVLKMFCNNTKFVTSLKFFPGLSCILPSRSTANRMAPVCLWILQATLRRIILEITVSISLL